MENQLKTLIVAGNLFPSPILTTDDNGEIFSIVPTFVSPGKYLVDVTVSWPETNLYKGSSLKVLDLADEINSYYKIDIESNKWSVERLTSRIGGDGFYSVNQDILIPKNLIVSDKDSILHISNCGICLYFDRIGAMEGQWKTYRTCTYITTVYNHKSILLSFLLITEYRTN